MRSKRNGGRERKKEGGMEEGRKRKKTLPAWDHVGKGLDDEGQARGGDETENK